jgi:phage terminase large subunit-like protein
MTALAFPAYALAHFNPEFFASLSDAERLVLPYCYDLWLRPEQRIPRGDWSYYGFICGRGFGKSLAISVEINRRVMAGESRSLALMAPTETRVDEVQVQFLIATAPPWFKPIRHNGGLEWPNGVRAELFTPLAPDRPRSGNYDLSWLCEIVDWIHTGRMLAFNNITTATRVGRNPQVIWDTTSKGKNDVIQKLMAMNKADPRAYPIQRGAMFDNPLLSRIYLRTECAKYSGRQAAEEIEGKVFAESAGALWQQKWIDDHRRSVRPTNPELRLVSIDPALSDHEDADETGFSVGSRGGDSHAYIEEDLTDKMKPEVWGDLAVQKCADEGCAGVVIERNHLGDSATYAIKSRATNRGLSIEVLPRWGTKECQPFPVRRPGVIYVREVVSSTSKTTRAAGPAVETEAGRVHLIGSLADLELEFTTYVPGVARSPNRYDAAVHLVTELRGLWEESAPANPKADLVEAVKAQELLRAGLLGIGRRRVGL